MRIVVLGGTGFIGRRIVDELSHHHHEVIVVHRGREEVASPPGATHVHGTREGFAAVWPGILDTSPMGSST